MYLQMVRCGNNCATGIISSRGRNVPFLPVRKSPTQEKMSNFGWIRRQKGRARLRTGLPNQLIRAPLFKRLKKNQCTQSETQPPSICVSIYTSLLEKKNRWNHYCFCYVLKWYLFSSLALTLLNILGEVYVQVA